ncbi:hypothetical protein [Pseudonocardia sp. H11422]|uniref:hypothetical protein n=1 Tax=Pseudonocardia sp. H11422 TaxID=2835866 RepID=UPI001BDC6B8E|nr:hypothetical protein [Pseudonocardia sp. H11422]
MADRSGASGPAEPAPLAAAASAYVRDARAHGADLDAAVAAALAAWDADPDGPEPPGPDAPPDCATRDAVDRDPA